MLSKLKIAALGIAIGLGAIAAAPAQADGLYLNFGGGGVGVEVRDGYRDWRDDRWRERHEWRERRDWRAHRCSPDRALWKAERMGVRRARIEDVNRRSITVRGRSRGERIRVTFGRSPSCPIIG
ncbi:hypothetical protein [Mesorhizobium sp. L-8-3]|uniref:hypothetical protein n=1 Tax=Mesorhizobium sp. L-8-3 TaxID=2744522 RepID=UPI00192793BB|nr:hypothetical protein [Mesorhizobium sp. L-8-3]BCH23816.1 hypothetical protein MesoLjLb_36010 [Mesorhizobium sp. L-8-3]